MLNTVGHNFLCFLGYKIEKKIELVVSHICMDERQWSDGSDGLHAMDCHTLVRHTL